MTTNTVLIYINICRSFRIFQPRDDFSLIPAETKRKMQYMVMTIEWTDEKFILSYKAQGNDNVINLYNTHLRTAYQFLCYLEYHIQRSFQSYENHKKWPLSGRNTYNNFWCVTIHGIYFLSHSSNLFTIVRCNLHQF